MIKNIILTSNSENEKQKGFITLETTTQKTLVSIKLFGISPSEKCVLGIKCGDELFKVKLSGLNSYIIDKKLDLMQKVSVVVIEIENGKSKILVWGSNETTKVWQNSILFDFGDENKKEIVKQEARDNILSAQDVKNSNFIDENFNKNSFSAKTYDCEQKDDDQIGFDYDENNFETDEEIEKLIDENMSSFENELNDEKIENRVNDETDNKFEFLNSVREQIDELLLTNPHEEALENLIPNSIFVKVEKEDGNYYVFGVIKENDEISYIVYGIAGEFSVKPDDEFKNYYQWFPLNPDSPEGYGYYLMYQDALNGSQIEMILEWYILLNFKNS